MVAKKKSRFNAADIKILSALTNRAALSARLGMSYGGDRDLYIALGYKVLPSFKDDYLGRYKRQDVAKAVVNKPVEACWRMPPRITELDDEITAFEDAWNALVKEHRVYRQIIRADKLAGIGNYSVLLIGLDGGVLLSEEVTNAKTLLFLQPYSQQAAVVDSYVIDTNNARFGLPETYKIDIKAGADVSSTTQKIVHHSRIIHIAEDLLEDNVNGTPKLEAILNRLEDLERVVGGSAEGYWRGALPGFGMKPDSDAFVLPEDLEAMKDEMEEYLHGMKRYLRLKNMSVEAFAQQVADPSKHVSVILDLISAATAIPKRILLGSERGELASSMDEKNWLQVVDARRKNHCEPTILRSLIDRLIEFSVLPEPSDGYVVEWNDLMAPSDKEVADVGAVRAKAIKDYTTSDGGDLLLPSDMFLRKGLGLTDDEVAEANEQIKNMNDDLNEPGDDE